MRRVSLLISYTFLFAVSCVDSFKIPETSFDAGILVIDGFVNSEPGSITTINVSRSTPVTYIGNPRPELKAKISIEDSDRGTFTLPEKGNGVYNGVVNVNPLLQYRLRVKTLSGEEYLSDFVDVKHTPAIDSITYQTDRTKNGLGIYVSTHDSEKDARNYYWQFTETWEYHADCNNTNLKPQTWKCWRSEIAGKIILSSTSRLTVDIIDHLPLTFVDANSIKLSAVYSIFVKQYAVTDDALSYLQQLKKSTEQQGTLFDPQPGKVSGNFRCITNPEEPVLGYLFVNNVSEKRLFITQLPNWFFKLPLFLACTDPMHPGFPPTCGSPPASACSDCRVGGGSIVRPDYWIN